MNRIQRMIEHYDRLPEGVQFARPEDLVHLARSRELRADARILDVGCGQGQTALALAAAFPQAQVIGIDLARGQIDRAQAAARQSGLPNAQFQVADWQQFGLPPDGVDLVVATQVVQFLDDEQAFAEFVAAALAPGGLLLLRTMLLPEEDPGRAFANRVLLQFIKHSVRFYSERDLAELFREVGLSRLRIDKEEMWLDDLPADRDELLRRELRDERLEIEDVQRWFWAGTLGAVKR
ncbi:MAG TPA: class I SAM-dependent methyltransferase [Herpetosiphonaceae bacterium]